MTIERIWTVARVWNFRREMQLTLAPAALLMIAAFDLVVAEKSDIHHTVVWDHDEDVIIKQGQNLTLTCSLSGLAFFDVLRVTHTQGSTTRTLADSADVKFPYLRISRYIMNHDYNGGMASVSISYDGIQGEDSGTLGCYKLGNHEDSASYVTIKVLVPVKEIYIISISSDGTAKRLEGNDSDVYLEENVRYGVGCVAVVEGSPTLPDVKITIAKEDRTTAFTPENVTRPMMLESSLSSYKSEVKLWLVTQKPNINYNGKILRCTAAMNDYDEVMATARLTVRFVPRISCTEEIVAKSGSNATFICNIQSNPGCQLKWMIGDQKKQITAGKDDYFTSHKSTERDSSEATLTIVNIRDQHFTNYVLRASNDIGSASRQLSLKERPTATEKLQPHNPGKALNGRNIPAHRKQKTGPPYARNIASSIHLFLFLKPLIHLWTSSLYITLQ